MKKIMIMTALASLMLSACKKENEIPVEPEIEEVETSQEDALADAIENAESRADAMGQELSDATAPTVSAKPNKEISEDAAQ